MQISFSPLRTDMRLNLSRQGDTLVINGEPFDFSAIPEGATLPQAAVACDWLASDIERVEGVLRLALRLPHGARAGQATLFPVPMLVTEDGEVALPEYELPPPPENPDAERPDADGADDMSAVAGEMRQ